MICLDTAWLIDFLNGEKGAVESCSKLNDVVIGTTAINIFEAAIGIALEKDSVEDIRILDQMLGQVEVLPLDGISALSAAFLFKDLVRKGKETPVMDCLVASILEKNGYKKILTKNKKHFSRFKNLTVEEY